MGTKLNQKALRGKGMQNMMFEEMMRCADYRSFQELGAVAYLWGAFKNKEGTVGWIGPDGNVKFIEMNYKGKAVGNETSVANEKLEPFDAEAGSEVGKNIANIKV